MTKKIVITGIGATSPLGGTARESWEALLAGESGARTLPTEWADQYGLPVTFATQVETDIESVLSRVQVKRMDRTTQMALVSAQEAWADEESLSRLVAAPFGPLPGAQVIGVYVSEQLTHGWDLAVATGQPAEAAPDLAALGEQSIRAVLDALPRGGVVPFGPAIEPAPDAGPTERLAAYLGRSWPLAS